MCGTVAASNSCRSTGNLTQRSPGRCRLLAEDNPPRALLIPLAGGGRGALAGRDAAAAPTAGGQAGPAAGRVALGGRLALVGLLGLLGLGRSGRGPGGRRRLDRRQVEQLAEQRAGRVDLVDA